MFGFLAAANSRHLRSGLLIVGSRFCDQSVQEVVGDFSFFGGEVEAGSFALVADEDRVGLFFDFV